MMDSELVIIEESIGNLRTRAAYEFSGSDEFNVTYRAGFNDALNEIASLLNTIQSSPFANKWKDSGELPEKAGHYLCKGKDFYAVEYFDGKSFSRNESNWIRKWKEIEEK